MKHKPSTWLSCFSPNADAALRLFCFSYAGGSAAIFRNWAESLPRAVEVCAVQLPGRGSRLSEPSATHLLTLVAEIAQGLEPYLDKPCAFYGHSMGALVAFELTHLLYRTDRVELSHLFVSGCSAPQTIKADELTYNLPDDQFIEHLRELNGTPGELLENPELMQLMLPIIRADFMALETYSCVPQPKLACPVTAIGGLEDATVSFGDIKAWSEQTTASFSARMLPGDHFFIHSARTLLLQVLSKELHQLVARIYATAHAQSVLSSCHTRVEAQSERNS
jgi:medium-chain acyl-[acyl-carrier-protein] hydrolase